jgi:RimJ/RimL family protein N-acetyltransferase
MRREISRQRVTNVSAGEPPTHPLTDDVVTLRLPTEEDNERFARYGADQAMLEGIWIVGPRGADANEWAAELVSELRGGWSKRGGDHGGGLVIDEHEPCVGTVSFFPRAHRVVELIYGVAPPWRGRGVATRAARLAADWALTEGDFDRVELRIGEGHAVSRRVAAKAGFTEVERFETFVEGTGKTHIDILCVRTRDDRK